ncbi:MAG: acyl-CoA dehydrogenase family protein [Dehalococcoidia bacterium]
MEYFLNEQQKMVAEIARGITEERIKPARAELDEKEEFPWEIVKEIAAADLFRVFIPEEYEGLGGGCLDLCVAIEELSRGCCGVSICYAAVALGTIPFLRFGSDEQKAKYLPQIAGGQRLAAFGLTEASAGSDAGAMKSRADLDGDGYILNGTKQFISNGGEAEIYSIIALTNPDKGSRGASAFIVEKDTPGFSFGKKERKMGIRCSTTCELVFHNCRVPGENLVGKEGAGFIITLKTLDESRPGVASQGVGLGQGALEEAVAYARQRVQFGQTISSFQAIQHMIADMAIQVEAARALVYATARMVDSGASSFTEEGAMAKLFASDMAMKVTTDAVQVLGGVGYTREYPVEKMMRDAKILQIYEGTNQILRNDIISRVYKRKGMTA